MEARAIEIIEVPIVSAAIRALGAPTAALVRGGGLLMTCGMPPIDLTTGGIVTGSIEAQTRASMEAIRHTLAFAGSSLLRVMKATIYVVDPAMMADVNAVYRTFFPAGFPARTSAAIKPWPLDFALEIECVALA